MASTVSPAARSGVAPVLFNVWRVFIALWYLGGCVIHLYCALQQPQIYARFAETPLYPAMARVWVAYVMPHITFFALLLSAFELMVVVLLLSKGRLVTIALTASLLFNVFLVLLGLGYPGTPGSWDDFVANRLSNVLFVFVQLPLCWARFERTLPETIRRRFREQRAESRVP